MLFACVFNPFVALALPREVGLEANALGRKKSGNMHSSESTRSARAFAVQAHGGQRYGEHPYVVHLDAVAEHLIPYGELAISLGYLHDG